MFDRFGIAAKLVLAFGAIFALAIVIAAAGWFGFLELIKPRPDARVEIQIRRNGRELTRSVVLESQREEDLDTGETITAGRVGIWQLPCSHAAAVVGETTHCSPLLAPPHLLRTIKLAAQCTRYELTQYIRKHIERDAILDNR